MLIETIIATLKDVFKVYEKDERYFTYSSSSREDIHNKYYPVYPIEFLNYHTKTSIDQIINDIDKISSKNIKINDEKFILIDLTLNYLMSNYSNFSTIAQRTSVSSFKEIITKYKNISLYQFNRLIREQYQEYLKNPFMIATLSTNRVNISELLSNSRLKKNNKTSVECCINKDLLGGICFFDGECLYDNSWFARVNNIYGRKLNGQ